jgi:hypothetical protein
MSRHLARNPLAYVALLAALASTAVAAGRTLEPRNSVGTRQVVDRSLLAKDFKRGQLRRGPRGLRGPTGPAGPRGSQGAAGASARVALVSHGATDPASSSFVSTVYSMVTLTTQRAGPVLVEARLKILHADCGGGVACALTVGVYIDGQAVAGTGTEFASASTCPCKVDSGNVAAAGVAPSVAAGTHTIVFESRPSGGSISAESPLDAELHAVALR